MSCEEGESVTLEQGYNFKDRCSTFLMDEISNLASRKVESDSCSIGVASKGVAICIFVCFEKFPTRRKETYERGLSIQEVLLVGADGET